MTTGEDKGSGSRRRNHREVAGDPVPMKIRTAYTAEGRNFCRFSSQLQRGLTIFLAIPVAMNKQTQRRGPRQQRPQDRKLLSRPPRITSFYLDLLGSRSPRRDHSRPLQIAIFPARFVTTFSRSRSPLWDPLQRWCRHDPGSCRHPVPGTVAIVVVISNRREERHRRRKSRNRR